MLWGLFPAFRPSSRVGRVYMFTVPPSDWTSLWTSLSRLFVYFPSACVFKVRDWSDEWPGVSCCSRLTVNCVSHTH